jgi:hypothetical protein
MEEHLRSLAIERRTAVIRRRVSVVSCLLPAVVAATLAAAPAAAQPVPLAPETLLADENNFYCPLLAGGADGGYAFVWRGHVRAAPPGGVLGSVHELSPALAGASTLTARPGGWEVMGYHRSQNHFDLMAQSLGADGGPSGAVRRLSRGSAEVTPLPGGGFVTLWSGSVAVHVRVHDASGRPLGPPWRVRVGGYLAAFVVPQPDGFTLVWESVARRGDVLVRRTLWGLRFGADGRPRGGSRRLVSLPAPPPDGFVFPYYLAAAAPDGAFAIVSSTSLFAVSGEVTLYTFDAELQPLAPPVEITTAEERANEESFPLSLSIDADGSLLLLWAQYESPYEPDARGRVFERDGTPRGPAFAFASAASAERPGILCAVGAAVDDGWVIGWVGATVPPDEEDTTARIYFRRFSSP